jgi:hypothetical protein
VFGNNQRISGPIMRDVFPALKLSEEAERNKYEPGKKGRLMVTNLGNWPRQFFELDRIKDISRFTCNPEKSFVNPVLWS